VRNETEWKLLSCVLGFGAQTVIRAARLPAFDVGELRERRSHLEAKGLRWPFVVLSHGFGRPSVIDRQHAGDGVRLHHDEVF